MRHTRYYELFPVAADSTAENEADALTVLAAVAIIAIGFAAYLFG